MTRIDCSGSASCSDRCATQGVLIIGSGYLTHGLPFLDRASFEHNVVPGWSSDFDAWAEGGPGDWGDRHARRLPGRARDAVRASHGGALHPALRHLGTAADPSAPPTTIIEDFQMGLAKRSFQVA